MPERQRKPAPRLTEKERSYRALFEEQAASGRSLAEFAAERGLAAGTLSWWKAEIRRREAVRRGRPAPRRTRKPRRTPKLVPVSVSGDTGLSPRVAGQFEVSLPGGAAVRVPFDFDRASFERLVAVLEAAC